MQSWIPNLIFSLSSGSLVFAIEMIRTRIMEKTKIRAVMNRSEKEIYHMPEVETLTKKDNSGWSLFIFNTGRIPILCTNVEIKHKSASGKTVVTCPLETVAMLIKPLEHLEVGLTIQDTMEIQRFERNNTNQFVVNITDIDEKVITTKLDAGGLSFG